MTPRRRFVAAVLAVTIALALGVLAAWPIYRTAWLLVPAAAALVLGSGIAVVARRLRWPAWLIILTTLTAFCATVIPVAAPQRFGEIRGDLLPGIGRALIDGLVGIVLGWKQLLTLTLPVGSYQMVLVPAYVAFLVCSLLAIGAALRGGRSAPFAAVPLLVPVAFGALFGSAQASAPLQLGPLVIPAPRETALWCAAALLAVLWVLWSSGARRRAALRRGRAAAPVVPGIRLRLGNRMTRLGLAAGTLALALAAALLVSPLLGALQGNNRHALRDEVDPEIVLRERPSPLAAYRVFKRDAALDAPLFSVSAEGGRPERLRLAVLDEYDGVDFHVGTDEVERFTRYPSGSSLERPSAVTIRIGAGYRDIWVPLAGLGSVPEFSGPRAGSLADSFFVNRSTGSAITVPADSERSAAADEDATGAANEQLHGGAVETTSGLQPGDAYRVQMSAEPAPALVGGPASTAPGIELEDMPELTAWLRAQQQPSTAEGLIELIQRLRSRGYLSHSLSDGAGDRKWLERLRESYGARFSPSPGGQSRARVEQLFAQLNAQERAVGSDATNDQLVSGVGDDEQFSVAGALLARALGFDSRVVLGFRLNDAGSIPGVPACAETCTGENLAAWIEVRGSDGVWAPVDVSPQVEVRPSSPSEGQRLPEHPTTPEQRDAREVDPPVGVGDPADDAGQVDPEPASSSIWPLLRGIGLGAAAFALIAAPLLFLPLAKRSRRRRRRRDPHPELRALGAWHETVDLAVDLRACTPVEAGLRAGSDGREGGLGRTELARRLADAGFADARLLARKVDAAVFSAAGIGDDAADFLWQRADAQRKAAWEAAGPWSRLRSRYSLRSYGIGFAVRRRGRGESAVRRRSRRAGDDGPPSSPGTTRKAPL